MPLEVRVIPHPWHAVYRHDLREPLYWCSNQYVIQRTLAAVAEGQKASALRLFQGTGSVFHDGPRACVSPLRSGTGLD